MSSKIYSWSRSWWSRSAWSLSLALLALGAAACGGQEPTAQDPVGEPPAEVHAVPGVADVTEPPPAEGELPLITPPIRMDIQAWSGVDPNAEHPPMPAAFVVARVPKRLQDAPRDWLDDGTWIHVPPARFK